MANTKTFGPDMRIGSWYVERPAHHWRFRQGVPGAKDHDSPRTADPDRSGEADVARGCQGPRAGAGSDPGTSCCKQETPLSHGRRERLSSEVLHEVFGLGPLEPLLQDATINDILVNTVEAGIHRARWRTGEDQRGLQG